MTVITAAGHYNEFGENLNALLSLVKCIQTFHFSSIVLLYSTFLLSVASSIYLALSANKIYVVLSLSSALSRLNSPSISLEFFRHYISQNHFFTFCITSIPLLSSCFLFSRHHKFKQNHFVSSVSIASFFPLFFISSFILFVFVFSNFNFLKTTTTSVTNANSITIILIINIINLLIAISNYNKNSNPVCSFFTYLFTTKSIIFHYLLFFLLSLFLLSGRNFCTKFPHFSLLTDYCKPSSDALLYQQKQYEHYQLHNKHQNHENCYTLYLHCHYPLTFCQHYHQNRCQRHHYNHVKTHNQYHQLQQQQYHFQNHYLYNYRLYYNNNNNNYCFICCYYSFCNNDSKSHPCIDKYIGNYHRNGSYNRSLNSNNKKINRDYKCYTYLLLLNYRNFYRCKQLQQICNHLYLRLHFLQFRHNLTYHYLQNTIQNSNNHNPYCYHYKYYHHNSCFDYYYYYYYYYYYHYYYHY
ncbi:DNA-directed RNA polymerase subunit beta''-like isoform X2 [Octopus sinensis]|uniref:DNA-directed RNA polymerase subunit beta''-like isoform X2 n=1 Tax=Octopus sinensis TaxID=2607531 RepID=A0A7E6FJJ6_9MOLL|nr:DNA-directed RNA polymerase subunit beta''-like isoform X2 [Octopus sinensis]